MAILRTQNTPAIQVRSPLHWMVQGFLGQLDKSKLGVWKVVGKHIPQMVVNNGDESHGRIHKKISLNFTQIQDNNYTPQN